MHKRLNFTSIFLCIILVLSSFNFSDSYAAVKKNDVTENGKYKLIVVDGGDTNGSREKMVVVDVGFGSREYWAYTNKYGQLVKVIAKKIILQDEKKEPVKDGRYYSQMADVEGTEKKQYDKGHVIADSLGGVANAYNITPQDSVLNRHGDQAYMEKVIRDAVGCTDLVAEITYPNTKTQIPSKYKFTYKLNKETIVDEFDNINPDDANKTLNTVKKQTVKVASNQTSNEKDLLKKVDKNNNGKVTIAEAKAAGFKMPIAKSHWLYKYMTDADGDGFVGE